MIEARRAPFGWEAVVSALVALFALGGLASIAKQVHRTSFFIDLRPMYCAGRAIDAHASPYAVEPLRSCELAHGLAPDLGVIPAPLPPYVLAPFAAVARLPYDAIVALYIVLATVSLAAAAFMLGRLAGVSPFGALAGLYWSIGYWPISIGQLSVFAILATIAAAYAARAGQWRWAAVAACVALVQPQMGLPLVLALGLWHRPARVPLAIGVAVLAVLSLLTVGFGTTLTYVAADLPRHARAELYWPYQASLSWVLGALGLAPQVALSIGSLSYIGMLVIGLAVSYGFARRGETALALLAPPAFVALGGSYIHNQQIELALPLAFLCAARARTRAIVPALAFALLATADGTPRQLPFEIAFTCFAGFVVLRAAFARGRRAAYSFAALAAIVFGLEYASSRLPQLQATPVLDAGQRTAMLAAGPLASEQWRVYVDGIYRGLPIPAGLIAGKALTWCGLLIALAFAAAAARDEALLGAPT